MEFKFSINYNGKAEQRVLSYDAEEYSFGMDEPYVELIDFDLALNYLTLTVVDSKVVQILGFCPYGAWIKTNCDVPQNRQGNLQVMYDLYPVVTYGINDTHWPIYVNPNTGWVCVGNPEKSSEAVEFINNCVAVIGSNSDFISLWLKPRDLPHFVFE